MQGTSDYGCLAPSDTFRTQLPSLRVREHFRRGRREIVRARGHQKVFCGIFWKSQESYTRNVETIWLPKEELKKGETNDIFTRKAEIS